MGAQFWRTRSAILRFFRISENTRKHSFSAFFFVFFIISGGFLEAFGYLLASFWSLCRVFGALVSSFWVPLARQAVCGTSLLLFVVPLARLG